VYFTGLALGEWIVHEEAPNPGFVDPTWWRAIDPITKTVVLEKPEEGKEVNFVNEPLGCVDGYKINHFEQGLGGWQINATNASTGEVVSDVTDPGGYFQLRLRLGAWTISEVVQDGWVAVTAPDFTILVARPFTCEHVRFKNRTDFACVDVYKKDAYDAAGLPGWVINLQPAYGGVAKFDVTDGTGWVRFNELSPGEYIVSHDPLPGWMPAGPTATPITLVANGTCSVVTFYNRQTNESDPPTKSAAPPAQPAGSACASFYTVRPGDNLFRIALNHGIPLQRLREANGLTDTNLIRAGMVLCIPS
jgi:hypothetical protein